MAIYNEILAGRFARSVQKLFSMKGEVPTKQVAGEVMNVIELENMLALENRILLSWRSYGYEKFVAAGGAGTFAQIRLRNPVGSNVIAVVEKIFLSAGVNQNFAVSRGPQATADLGTNDSVNISIRDLRVNPTTAAVPLGGAVSTSFSNNLVSQVGVVLLNPLILANTSIDLVLYPNQELVIAPGDVLTVGDHVGNSSLTASLYWRERTLEETELQNLQ